MIKLTSFRLFVAMPFVLLIGIIVSCNKKEDVPNDGKTALYSFGPTGSKIGDTIRFIGVNLDKVTAIKFTGVNAIVDKAKFTQQTSDIIKAIVPQEAERGQVLLRLSNGDSIVSKSPLNLDVLATITGINPKTARPGENITISGTYLNWVDRVTFDVGNTVTNFVSKTQTELVVTIPDAAQSGLLVVHYGGTDSADLETTDTLKVTLPKGTLLSPNPVKHGDNLTITGTDLDLVRKVTFTGEPNPITSFVSQSATELVVKVPAATTKGKVTIQPGSGIKQTVGNVDLSLILPAVTAMSPNPVDTLTNVTLTGTNLDLVTSVSFVARAGGTITVTSFGSQSPTEIVLAVPGPAGSGQITMGVKNSTVTVKSPMLLGIVGAPPPPIVIFDDVLTWNGWIGGGWGGSKDLANTSPVQSGSKSIKISYVGDWGVPLQLGGANISLVGYTTLKLSIYGGTGSNNQNVNIGFNEADGKTVTIVEGQWTNFTIALNQISSATTLSFLYLKKYSTNGDFTIYVDNLGVY
jgi:IPT/TIG domain-containing protein